MYSRITGYYRPVQNWNDGKAQEFKDRQIYDSKKEIGLSHAPVRNDAECDLRTMLFTTASCPNCRIAKSLLDEAGINYDVIDAEDEKNRSLVKEYGIMQAPTLVVPGEAGARKYANVSNIKQFMAASK